MEEKKKLISSFKKIVDFNLLYGVCGVCVRGGGGEYFDLFVDYFVVLLLDNKFVLIVEIGGKMVDYYSNEKWSDYLYDKEKGWVIYFVEEFVKIKKEIVKCFGGKIIEDRIMLKLGDVKSYDVKFKLIK